MFAGDGAGTRSIPVPSAKIVVPRVPDPYLLRPRLVERLDARAPGQLTVVSAPAGYGKTLLLADWAQRRPGRCAWVSLDEGDNDERGFWAAVLAALRRCGAVPPRAGLDELDPPRPGAEGRFVTALVNALGDGGEPVALVLDDVHELTSPATLRGLAALVRHRPAELHLVLSGRTDPPLHLARMRLAGELHEVRARDLRFSVPEAAHLLADAEVDVRADQVERLVEQTDGWPAGLRLAALSLRTCDDPDRFLGDFAANDRAVAEYLVGEILDRLPAEVCDLLRAVSVCPQLTGDLAATLAGRPDAADMLDGLERQTSLVLSVGNERASYRVHPLLRAHLRADLKRRHPERLAEQHARAAAWYLAAGQPEVALHHAADAGDRERLLDLLAGQAVELVARGRHTVLQRMLRRAGPPEDPRAALVAALLALENGTPPDAGSPGGPAAPCPGSATAPGAHHLPADAAPAVQALAAVVRSRRAAAAGGPHAVLRVGAELGVVAEHAPSAVAWPLLDLAVALRTRGRTWQAWNVAQDALRQARRPGHRHLEMRALLVLSGLAFVLGEHRRMDELAERAHGLVPAERAAPADLTEVSALRALAALLRGEPAGALELAAPAGAAVDGVVETVLDGPAPGYADAPQRPVPAAPLLLAVRGAARLDLGRENEGLADLRRAHALAASGAGDPAWQATVAVLAHGGAVATGRHQLARELLAWADETAAGTGELLYLHARQQLLRGRPAAAAELLERLRDGAQPPRCRWVAVEVEVLACRLALSTQRRTSARQSLDRALDLAGSCDVLRPLALAPSDVADLLVRGLGGYAGREAVAVRALALHTALRRDDVSVPLTDRERAVLRLLPTQRSIHEIAEDLTVSESTVKTHVRAIYGKLGVRSRRDAVAMAHRRGVL